MSPVRLPSRRKRRYDNEPPLKVILRGLAVLGAIGLFVYVSTSLYSGVPMRDYRYVEAKVPQTGSLLAHDPVRMGGVRIGQVNSIGTARDGQGLLELQIEPGTDLRADTGIRIRANGLLGARFVELVQGRSSEQLAAGKQIRGDEESLTFSATDALDTFDRQTRGALRPLVGELAQGLLGQGRHVNDAVRIGANAIVPVSELFAELAEPTTGAERLLPSLESGITPLDDNRVALTRLAPATADALAPLVDRRDSTRDTLSEAPAALAAAHSGLTEGRTLLTSVRSLSTEARRTLPDAPEGFRQAAALLREGREPVRRTEALLKAAEPAVPAALRITGTLRPLLKPATGLLENLGPIFRYVGTYKCDIANFGAVFRSMTGFGTKAGGGPGGPAMQFRLQVAAPVPTEMLSAADTTGLVIREGYAPPCRYLSKPYPIISRPSRGGKK